MKNIKKTYLLMILLLSLSVPSYACFPDTLEDFKDWCDQNGLSYNEYDSLSDFYGNASDEAVNAFLNSSDIYDRELPTVNVTAPKITNTPLTDLSTFGQEVPTNSSVWTAVLDPEPDYNPTNAKPRDCAGVEGGSAYLDNCQECVGGTTGKEPCDCDDMQCPFCGGIIIPVDAPMRSPGMMRTGTSCPTCKCDVKTKLFLDKCAGYNYIWQMSHDANGNFIREVAGLVLEGGSVLIIPFENNVLDHAFTKVFTYVETATGGLGVKLNGKVYEIVQIIHSHPGEINPYSENPLRYSPDDDGWWARRLGHDIQILMDGGLYLVGDSSYASYYNLNQINSPCEQ